MTRRVAIIGYSFRLPGTDSKRCWKDLLEGRDLITSVHSDRWAQDTLLHPDRKHPGTSVTFAAGSIGDIAGFDAAFFGISPREASMMDPQQRLLLEMSWEALENAGIKPSSLRGSSCGVFIGISHTEYSYRLATDQAATDSFTATGNTNSIGANRLSYFFDLHGPSMAIDTACSSSLVAFHQACSAILAGKINQALTGAINLHLHPQCFLGFSKASMLSKQGRCRPFDAAADGYVRSEGGGIFFLKEYTQAIKDKDPILAIVANTAVNTDGKKSGLTVPSTKVQAELLEQAYSQAGIAPSKIDYIEAHGTGTPVGDPIEAQAISQALGVHRPKNKPLPIGSVKSNLGHLETASGVAGLVKALYAIQHRVVPGTIGIENLNPHIPLKDWNLKLFTKAEPLKKKGKLIIGINSFGFGGSNAHVILESPKVAKPGWSGYDKPDQKGLVMIDPRRMVPFFASAKEPTALKEAARTLASFLQESAEPLETIAYNTFFHRDWHVHRLIVQGMDKANLTEKLLQFADNPSDQSGITSGTSLKEASQPAFIYSGNGSQWAGMGKQLLEKEPLFRKTIQEIETLFREYADYSLQDELAGKNGSDRYQFTEIAQPALFALQVGLTQLLRSRGIHPAAVAGHSIGEVAAAWASGALSLQDAVKVVAHRSRLQGLTKGKGGMTAIGIGLEATEELLKERNLTDSVAVAGVNSSKGVTLAGDPAPLANLESTLNARGIFNKRLDLDYAFHSPVMNELEADIKESLSGIKPKKCAIPFYSTVSGERLEGEQLSADYWWKNIREPVQFEKAVKAILKDDINLFIEIGPHHVLRSYLNDCLKDMKTEGSVISTLARGDDSPERVWTAHHLAAIAGAPIDWKQLFPTPQPFVQLPNYSWQKERYWHPVTAEAVDLINRRKIHPFLGYPIPQQELTWENQLDTQLYPTLADHKVGDATLFPGAGFAELALAAASAWQGTKKDVVEIEDLEIRAPLLLQADHSKNIRLKIESQDGSFTIKSREYTQQESWVLNSVGRILPTASCLSIQSPCFSLPTRPHDFDAGKHKQITLGLGLDYGPAFQSIEKGWVEKNEVIAVLVSPESIKDEILSTHLHPSFLDGAFQLLFQLLKQHDASPEAFIPIKIERLSFHLTPSKPCFAQASLVGRTPHSIVAAFTLFNENHQPIANLSGVRFRKAHFAKKPGESLQFLDYYAKPVPILPSKILSFEMIEKSLKKLTQEPKLQDSYRRYTEEVDPLLESLSYQFERESLPEGSENLNSNELGVSAQEIWNELLAELPDYSPLIQAVGYARVKTTLPHEQFFSELTRHVIGSEGKQKIEQTLRQLIIESLNNLLEGQHLNILEICEGPPLFASAICSSLDFTCSGYAFTSPSKATLGNCESLQERYPNILLNPIDATPKSDHQVVLVTLDFQNPGCALQALEYAKKALCEDGTLLVLGLPPTRWIDFIFRNAPQSPQRPLQFWEKQLNDLLFTSITPLELVESSAAAPYLLLARCKNTPTILQPVRQPRNWLFLTSKSGYESQLSAHLKEQLEDIGDSVTEALPEDEASLTDLISNLRKARSKLNGILHLRGLSPHTPTEALLDSQASRCALTASLARACEATQTDTTIWLITSRANKASLPPRSEAEIKSSSTLPADATLWGFGRTLLNETSQYSVRLVDFEDLLDVDATANALFLELEHPDEEQEILITKHGARYAPRLRSVDFSNTDQAKMAWLRHTRPGWSGYDTPDQDGLVTLGFESPGQLRHLRWEMQPGRLPAPDEVEVEVHATGLNFRDVMYALGLLSDEAIESGFAGPTLGMEFSGIVRRVGDRVLSFAPGDRVVGFAPSSFANRIITKEGTLTPIPNGLSFEAAATIPSTFFTVYYSLKYLARLQPGETILIHGAAGGVGLAAIQVARWMGAEIYTTAGSQEKHDFLHLLGIKHLFDSRSLSFADEILAITHGRGVDVVLNSLSGEAINRNLKVLKPFGRFLELGKRDFYENTKIGLRPFRNNISYFGIDADQLMQEQPELTQKLFGEVMELFNNGKLHPLPYHTFEADEIVEAFRYMQQAKQIGKIVVTYRNGINKVYKPTQKTHKNLELDPNASYLVTGGLKGFGLKTAEWLVSKGARQLILVNRSGLISEEAQAIIAGLENQGVRVVAAACDVSDKSALSNLLNKARITLPPLKGIVHAAAVIEDSIIRNTDAQKIAQVLAPKVLGAQHLHDLTAKDCLDFFLLFSSATTLFGNPGQASYIAANSYLEALAMERRLNGLPATCVRWGPIDDVGFLARNQKTKEALKGRMGGNPLQSATAFDALEKLLVTNNSGVGVLELDKRALQRFLPSAKTPKFKEFFAHVYHQEEYGHSENILQLLEELSPEELLSTFTEMVKKEIGQILRLSLDKIESNRPIYEMGLDSLMAVEVALALEARFGVRLPAMELNQTTTIYKLTERIIQLLRKQDEEKTSLSSLKTQFKQLSLEHGVANSSEVLELIETSQALK